MRKIIADELTALGGQAPHCLVSVDDAYDWSGDKKGARIGTFYTILRPIDVEKVRVLVHDSAPAVDPAVFQSVNLAQLPRVTFEQFSATIGVNSRSGSLAIYAEAASVKLATAQK